MALYFYFNETTGDLVYSDKATYDVDGYVSLGEQVDMNPNSDPSWVFDSQRSAIVTISKDKSVVGKIAGLKSMYRMFSNCTNLTSLDLSGFDTSSVTRIGYMFSKCSQLISLDLSVFDTSAVTSMLAMFNACSTLTSLDLSGFDTSAATDMNSMFNGCYNLASLDLSGFDTSAVMSMNGMFNSCDRLYLITISDKMSNVLSQLPADQYYPAAGGSPVAKADLTAGTWVRDEADLSLVTSIVEQAQMSQAISRRIGGVRRDLEAQVRETGALLGQLDYAAGGIIPVENGGTGADNASDARTALGLNNIYSRAPYVKSKSATGALYAVTVVRTVSNMYMSVMKAAEIRSLIGRNAEWGRDFAIVTNGDESASKNQVHTLLNITTCDIDARIRSETGGDPETGPMRFDVLIYAG